MVDEDIPQKLYIVKKIYTGMNKVEGEAYYPAKNEHTSYESALEEAKRLQGLHGGCFMVFESIYFIKSVRVTFEGKIE